LRVGVASGRPNLIGNQILKNSRFQNQHGAVTILTGFVMMVAVGALAVLGLGQTVWEKNRAQYLVDQSAMTAARQLSDGPAFEKAFEVAELNGLLPDDILTINCVINNVVTANCDEAVTARATLIRKNKSFFLGATSDIVTSADATNAPVVAAMVSSSLANLNSQKSALLNGLLTGLGGGVVNLSVADYKKLLGANVVVDLVKLGVELGAATPAELLALNLTALDLLQEGLAVGQGDNQDKTKFQGVLGQIATPLNQVEFTLGDVLALDLSGETSPGTSQFLNVNLGELAQAAILRSAKDDSYTINISEGLLNLSVGVTILQPPQIFVGRKLPFKSPIAQGKTAQVALDIRAVQNLNLVVANANVDMAIQLKVAGGLAQVDSLTCSIPRENNVTSVTLVPALAEVCISQSAADLKTNVSGLTCGAPANIATVTLLGIPIGVKLGATASARANPTSFDLQGAAPPGVSTGPVYLNSGQSLANLLGGLQLNLELNVPLVGGLLKALLNPLLTTLLSTLNIVLSPVLVVVGGILDGLLTTLGVGLNEVNVTVQAVDCSSVVLSR
jgi:uncharacterized membrane protein